ncbi:MAG: DUF2442 domain-containing protein [Lachnospiraceae bacterium]|nr:DUF2442 domain-containing protein [Lachnospiraceae bacterium]
MYIVNGIAYAREISENISVTDIKVLDDMVLIVTFSTGEQRLFDATCLLEYPAFEPLKNEEIFKTAKVEYGVVVWNDGDIDIAPETMYQKSYAYTPIVA